MPGLQVKKEFGLLSKSAPYRNSHLALLFIPSKIYSSQNAYQNHLQSKKHKESSSSNPSSSNSNPLSAATIKAKSDSATASVVSSAQEREWRNKLAQVQSEEELAVLLAEKMATATRLTDTQCLFCTHTAESIDANMNHMCTAHSFFVPDIEYLADLRGLVAYLGEKVAVAHMCLFCNGKGRAFHSIESVRKHMV